MREISDKHYGYFVNGEFDRIRTILRIYLIPPHSLSNTFVRPFICNTRYGPFYLLI